MIGKIAARFRRPTIAACAGLGVALALTACGNGGGSPTTSGGVINAKFTVGQNYGSWTVETAQYFDSLVKKYTNGKINITVYPNNSLGNTSAQVSGMQNNTIQFMMVTSGLDTLVPSVDALGLPYAFPSAKVASVVLNNGSLNKTIWNLFPAKGLHYIGSWEFGYTSLLAMKKKVTVPTDLKGMNIRVVDPVLGAPEYKIVGANAVNVSADQMVTAMTTGVVSGVDDPAATFASNGWDEQGKYLTETNFSYLPAPVTVSEKFWDSLSKADQDALVKAQKDTINYNLTLSAQTANGAADKMSKLGIVVVKPDLSLWAETFKPSWATFENQYPDAVHALQSAVSSATSSTSSGS